MFNCHVCGSTEVKGDFVNEVFHINNKPVLVEHIPAIICVRCGEENFSSKTMERIRKMIHGKATPVKSISMDVFNFA